MKMSESFTIKFNYKVPFIAEVYNINVNNIDQYQIEDLQSLFRSTPVLIFKNQNLTPSQQYEFCKHFDPKHTDDVVHPFQDTQVPDCPQIALRGKGIINDLFGVKDTFIQNGKMFRYNRVWHQDLVGTKNRLPTVVSSMYMIQTPRKGGTTLFASLEKAYENLSSSPSKLKFFPLRSCYSTKHSLDAEFDYTGYSRIDKYWKPEISHIKELKDEIVIQPLVIYPDSRSRKKSLMLSPNKLYSFFGIDPEKSQELMRELCNQFIFVENNIGEVFYKKNDLIIFNNRRVVHSSTPTEEVEGNRIFSLLFLDTKDELKSAQ